jgi:hypothetical protein
MTRVDALAAPKPDCSWRRFATACQRLQAVLIVELFRNFNTLILAFNIGNVTYSHVLSSISCDLRFVTSIHTNVPKFTHQAVFSVTIILFTSCSTNIQISTSV